MILVKRPSILGNLKKKKKSIGLKQNIGNANYLGKNVTVSIGLDA